MTINDLIEKLSNLPNFIREGDLTLMDENGQRLIIRDDVSQGQMMGGDFVYLLGRKPSSANADA